MRARRITYNNLRKACELNDYQFYDRGDYNLNIIGIRNDDMRSNLFNDWICLAFRQNDHEQLFIFSATTDPGLYWREHPMNVKGTAILKPGHHAGMFTVGQHRGAYTALVQNKPATVYRDNDGNAVIDGYAGTPQERGMFGINLHRAGRRGSSAQVDKWSAGCQVISNSDDFDLFMAIIARAAQEYGQSFSYTLLTESQAWGSL